MLDGVDSFSLHRQKEVQTNSFSVADSGQLFVRNSQKHVCCCGCFGRLLRLQWLLSVFVHRIVFDAWRTLQFFSALCVVVDLRV